MTDLRSFYEAGYTVGNAAEAERLGRWRALGAESKSSHVRRLLALTGVRPESLVEIGCGDGSLLQALSGGGVASIYDGFEISEPAVAIAGRRRIAGVRRIEAYDGERVPAADGSYDVAVLSHVLEHVPRPGRLLAEAARVAQTVIVEVPLEDNRSAARPAKRRQAREIGHLHAFSREEVRRLAAEAGLRVAAELTDPLPRRHHAFFARGSAQAAAASAKWAVRSALHRLAPRVAERLFTVHYAALLRR